MIRRHNGIPRNLVHIIQTLFENFECRVIHDNHLIESFAVNTGVKLENEFIQEDPIYANILDLLSYRHQDILQKTEFLNSKSYKIGFNDSTKKRHSLSPQLETQS